MKLSIFDVVFDFDTEFWEFYVLDTCPLPHICFVNISSQSVAFYFLNSIF